MAQAPGPGDSRTGLGILLNDIQDADNDLSDLFTDQKLFAQSWSNHWTPLADASQASNTAIPSATSSNPASVPTQTPEPAKKTLSTGAKAGIGIGVAATALFALGAIVLFLRSRRRKRNSLALEQQPPPAPPEKDPVEAQTGYHVPYADNERPGYYEMEHPPTELVSHSFMPHEMPATPVMNRMPVGDTGSVHSQNSRRDGFI